MRVQLFAVVAKLVATGEPFSFAKVIATMGTVSETGSPDYQRARRAFVALVNAKMLKPVARGSYVQGETPLAPSALGEGVALREAVVAALCEAGGYAHRGEIADALGVVDEGTLRVLARVVAEDDRIRGGGGPLDGSRAAWRLRDDLRQRTVLSGRWARLDGVSLAMRAGAAPANVGDAHMDRWSARVGAAIREARLLLRLDIEAMAAGAAGDELRRCLDGSTDSIRRFWHSAVAGDPDGALVEAWTRLETPEEGQVRLAQALDVRFWTVLGNMARLDAAALSRGGVCHDLSVFDGPGPPRQDFV